MSAGLPNLLPGRECGSCTACCALFAIAELNKPPGVLCSNSGAGGRCSIYDRRPDACRIFQCGYRTWDQVPADWRPDRTHFVLGGQLSDGRFLSVTVDPVWPEAWRTEPYYRTFKTWSRQAIARNSQVVVFIGLRAIVLRPENDVDLGLIAADEILITSDRMTPQGVVREVIKVKRNDPRLQAIRAEKR